MARTDKHTPYLYKERSNFVEYHNHKNSVCDIPSFEDYRARDSFKSNCGYELKISYLYEHPLCPCSNCRDKVSKRAKNKKLRSDKSYLKEI